MTARAPLLDWWEEFVAGCDKAKIRVNREITRDPSQRLRSFLERYAPTLYLGRFGLGMDLNKLAEEAEYRLSAMQRAMLKELQGKESL